MSEARAGAYEIRYASDPKHESIPWIERRNTRTGKTETYVTDGAAAAQAAALPKHAMQCVDCHDRPTHAFLPPDRALNRAVAFGQLPVALPFIKKQGLAALQASYSSDAEASRKISDAIESFYERTYPDVYQQR